MKNTKIAYKTLAVASVIIILAIIGTSVLHNKNKEDIQADNTTKHTLEEAVEHSKGKINIETEEPNNNIAQEILSIKTATENITNKVHNTFFTESEQYKIIELPLIDRSTNEIYGKTDVLINNNIVWYEADSSYLLATTDTDAYIYVDTYDYSGVHKSPEEWISANLEWDKEIADYNNLALEEIYSDNESFVYMLDSDKETEYVIHKFNEDITITYRISFDNNMIKNNNSVDILLNQMNINIA